MVLDCQELTKEALNSLPSQPTADALADDHSSARDRSLHSPMLEPATSITIHCGKSPYFLVACHGAGAQANIVDNRSADLDE